LRPSRGASNPRLAGKTALITGGGQGIGLAIAHALAAEGCNLIIAGRNQKTLGTSARSLERTHTQVLSVVCDIRLPAQVNALAAAVRKRFRRLDILINNSGVGHPGLPIAKLPFESWKEVIETNLNGLFLVTQSLLPLIRDGGTIVNNLSIAVRRVFPGASAYAASKHGALGFTNALREELRPRRIRVIALMPGATDTDIWNTFWPEAPRKKMMPVSAVAEAVVGALILPANATVEELVILPSVGAL
jgi:NAD(P)-dependent dehydrogenase (short-subunit alcohol dehydrogenase family)